ncbi:MAG: hypothetical protein EOO77_41775 [Oxalobacteraceae bacterium]|nr:MAG: hypothetical protein EOO77_41775 [Oxalobacteraceae bacterium]
MRREADIIARERAAAEARKADTIAYQRKLAEQMAVAAEESDWLDRYYADEAAKSHAKRQAVWDAEAAARASLMTDVGLGAMTIEVSRLAISESVTISISFRSSTDFLVS